MWGSDRALTKAVIYHSGVSLSIYFLSEEKLELEFWPTCPQGTRCCWSYTQVRNCSKRHFSPSTGPVPRCLSACLLSGKHRAPRTLSFCPIPTREGAFPGVTEIFLLPLGLF